MNELFWSNSECSRLDTTSRMVAPDANVKSLYIHSTQPSPDIDARSSSPKLLYRKVLEGCVGKSIPDSFVIWVDESRTSLLYESERIKSRNLLWRIVVT